MKHLKYIRVNELPPYDTVSDLVEVFEKTIEHGREWDRLVSDFAVTNPARGATP